MNFLKRFFCGVPVDLRYIIIIVITSLSFLWFGNDRSHTDAQKHRSGIIVEASGNKDIGFINVDNDGLITSVSPWVLKALEYKKEEMVGRDMRFIMVEKIMDIHQEKMKEHFKGDSMVANFEICQIIGKNRKVLDVYIFMVLDPNVGGFCAIGQYTK